MAARRLLALGRVARSDLGACPVCRGPVTAGACVVPAAGGGVRHVECVLAVETTETLDIW